MFKIIIDESINNKNRVVSTFEGLTIEEVVNKVLSHTMEVPKFGEALAYFTVSYEGYVRKVFKSNNEIRMTKEELTEYFLEAFWEYIERKGDDNMSKIKYRVQMTLTDELTGSYEVAVAGFENLNTLVPYILMSRLPKFPLEYKVTDIEIYNEDFDALWDGSRDELLQLTNLELVALLNREAVLKMKDSLEIDIQRDIHLLDSVIQNTESFSQEDLDALNKEEELIDSKCVLLEYIDSILKI